MGSEILRAWVQIRRSHPRDPEHLPSLGLGCVMCKQEYRGFPSFAGTRG